MLARFKAWLQNRKDKKIAVAILQGMLDEAREEVAFVQNLNGGLERSVAFLQQVTNENYNNFLKSLAALVASRGGKVTLSKDFLDAIEADDDIEVKYTNHEDGSRTIELVAPSEQEASADAAAESCEGACCNCDGGCDLGCEDGPCDDEE